MGDDKSVDFAISYAGEDIGIAREIARRLRELGFSVFLAGENTHLLVGADAESFFEQLFADAKEVIVLVSENYKKKDWPRFEWDVIRERDPRQRFIPIRLDDAKMVGLPSTIIYLRFPQDDYDAIVSASVKRLLLFEKTLGIARPTEYERILDAIKGESKGALAQAYQLVKDNRQRTPLEDCELPQSDLKPSYEIVEKEWSNFSVVRRLAAKILISAGLSQEELRFNLEHCAATLFNAFKPDAVMVFAYSRDVNGYGTNGAYTAGRAVFAPFGKWEKAQDGVAYNIATSEFSYSIDFVRRYFSA